MDSITLLKDQVQQARELMEATMADVTPELATWLPEGKALPIAAHYAHALVSEDMGLHGLVIGSAPLAVSSWAGKTGFVDPPALGPGQSWEVWARQTRFDLAALREYAAAVYAATDECLAGLTDEALAGTVDLSSAGLDERSLAWFLTTGWVANVHLHCGEISCLKGLRGLKGYPGLIPHPSPPPVRPRAHRPGPSSTERGGEIRAAALAVRPGLGWAGPR